MSKELKDKIKSILDSKFFKNLVYGLGVFIVVMIIFQAGIFVGFHKASFGRDWGDNYEKNFGSPHRGGQMMGGDFGNLPNPNGAIGKIIKIELPNIVVLDGKDQTEKVVIINDDTLIRKMRDNIEASELKLDTYVVVIGSPNENGQIESKLIRLLPPPPDLGDSMNKNN